MYTSLPIQFWHTNGFYYHLLRNIWWSVQKVIQKQNLWPLQSQFLGKKVLLSQWSHLKTWSQTDIFKRFSNTKVLLIYCVTEPEHIVKLPSKSRVNTQWVRDISILLPEWAAKQLTNFIFFELLLFMIFHMEQGL